MKGVLVVILASLILAPSGASAREREYQERWCEEMGGRTEVVLADGTRVDCLTERWAVEVDFGKKWAEAVGQALFYAAMTHRLPGILLILPPKGGEAYLIRLNTIIHRWGLPIKVWVIRRREE